jgi:hypothetical protein
MRVTPGIGVAGGQHGEVRGVAAGSYDIRVGAAPSGSLMASVVTVLAIFIETKSGRNRVVMDGDHGP